MQCAEAAISARRPRAVDVIVPTDSRPFRVRVSGVSAVKCAGCGESFLSGPDLGRAELLAGAEAIARGLRAGTTLKFVRKALGLRAVELLMLTTIRAFLDVLPAALASARNWPRLPFTGSKRSAGRKSEGPELELRAFGRIEQGACDPATR